MSSNDQAAVTSSISDSRCARRPKSIADGFIFSKSKYPSGIPLEFSGLIGKRRSEILAFRNDPNCRLFLSTDSSVMISEDRSSREDALL